MKVLVLGACGTFMAGIASIAKSLGHDVMAVDEKVYPPMSDALRALGIELLEGYHHVPALQASPDQVIIGNALSRGNVAVEHVLDQSWNYVSGPAWLAREVLCTQHVIAVSGTHGKTTTTSMIVKILEDAGLSPGYLIGGISADFSVPARLGSGRYFVIEADEYDTAFFDKASKFLHYRPKTLIVNNLEYDHADIFEDLAAILKQFHVLIRTVPASGDVIYHAGDTNIQSLLNIGCWSNKLPLHIDQSALKLEPIQPDCSKIAVSYEQQKVGEIHWSQIGRHNLENAAAAIQASLRVGVPIEQAIRALSAFSGVKRRMECIANVNGIHIYDDFAHHPSAIKTTIAGLRAKIGNHRMVLAAELSSHTMRNGVHKDRLMDAYHEGDSLYLLRPKAVTWDVDAMCRQSQKPVHLFSDVASLIDELALDLQPGDHVLIMSNQGFGGIYQKLPKRLKEK